ncbi:MAG: carbon-nitrogen hydrolase family protein, partial [Pirellulales bacterium]|nr:carbon-nitrogen hydrolase family protein [Pirellulales bacterium]
ENALMPPSISPRFSFLETENKMTPSPRISCWPMILMSCFVGKAGSAEPAKVNRDQVKIAAVQISGYDKGDLPKAGYEPANLFVPYINRAGKDGAQLVVFPEYVLGRISVPGKATDTIAAAAKANSIYVIVGCWEVFEDGTFANTALVFDRDGSILGKYRKTHAAVDQYEGNPAWAHPPRGKTKEWMIRNDPEWVMEKGTELPVFEFDFGKVGILTCYDGWFPEPARVLSLQGAELIVWINGRGGTVEDFIVKSIMFQSHVAMITTNQAYGGGTMIGDCSRRPAKIIAQTSPKQESYISATVNLRQIRHLRANSRNFQQRRPDLYGPLVRLGDANELSTK